MNFLLAVTPLRLGLFLALRLLKCRCPLVPFCWAPKSLDIKDQGHMRAMGWTSFWGSCSPEFTYCLVFTLIKPALIFSL